MCGSVGGWGGLHPGPSHRATSFLTIVNDSCLTVMVSAVCSTLHMWISGTGWIGLLILATWTLATRTTSQPPLLPCYQFAWLRRCWPSFSVLGVKSTNAKCTWNKIKCSCQCTWGFPHPKSSATRLLQVFMETPILNNDIVLPGALLTGLSPWGSRRSWMTPPPPQMVKVCIFTL